MKTEKNGPSRGKGCAPEAPAGRETTGRFPEELRQSREIDRLNERLREKIAEYEMLMKATGVAIMKVRLDAEFSIEWCNDAVYEMAGYSREEHLVRFGGSALRYFTSQGSDGHHSLIAAIRDALEKDLPGFETLAKLPTRTGFIWVKGVGTFDRRDSATGRPSSIYAVYTDVTEVLAVRERATTLESENAQLRRIIDNVPAGIGVSVPQETGGQQIVLNRYFRDMLGLTSEQPEEDAVARVVASVWPEDAARCRADIHRLVTEGTPLNGTYRFCRGDGADYLWLRVEGRMVRTPDGGSASYFSYTDVDELKRTETALRSSRRVYEAAIRATKTMVWEYDLLNRRILLAGDPESQRDMRELGLPRIIENVPDSLLKAIDEGSRPAFLEMYRLVGAGQDASCEVWTKPADPEGEPCCFRVVYTVERDESGRTVRAYGLRQDITEQKKAEERYERELANLRSADSANLIAKGRHNLTRNRVLDYMPVSEKAHEIPTRQTYDDAVAAFARMPYAPEDRKKLAALLERGHLMRAYNRGETHFSFQYCRQKARLAPNWVTTVVNTYLAPATGDIECFIYTYDVTEQILKDQILNRLPSLGFDELGLLYPANGICTAYRVDSGAGGRAVEHAADYEAMLTKLTESFFLPDQRAEAQENLRMDAIARRLAEEGTASYSFAIRRGREGARYKRFQYSWLDDSRNTIFYCLNDITKQTEDEQRQIRELQEAKLEADRASEAKSMFLSSMSHDLRTPLNGIIGFTDLAVREEDDGKRRDYLAKIQFSGRLLLNLVNDTLELSRIESGKMVLEPEDVDSRELGEAVVNALRPAAELKGVRLDADVNRFVRERVRVDKLKVQKIFLNLLSNAIKFTPAGGTVRVSVEALEPPEAGCNRRITVSDTGVGISPEFLPNIFEPFSQEHLQSEVNTMGTGLGLTIVRRVVDLMGGVIRVRSAVGEGTCFTVDLPVQPAESAAAAAERRPERDVPLAGRRVLLCEDNYLNAEIATVLLRERGMTADWARNGREGAEKFRSSPEGYYDAVLMDIRMPILDGCGAARTIRAMRRPDAAAVPILAMTADAFEEDIRRVREAGMNGHIPKPVEPEKLYGALSAALSGGGWPSDSGSEKGE